MNILYNKFIEGHDEIWISNHNDIYNSRCICCLIYLAFVLFSIWSMTGYRKSSIPRVGYWIILRMSFWFIQGIVILSERHRLIRHRIRNVFITTILCELIKIHVENKLAVCLVLYELLIFVDKRRCNYVFGHYNIVDVTHAPHGCGSEIDHDECSKSYTRLRYGWPTTRSTIIDSTLEMSTLQ